MVGKTEEKIVEAPEVVEEPKEVVEEPKEVVEEPKATHTTSAIFTPKAKATTDKYENSPFPLTCHWLEEHGLDPNQVGLTGINKGGYENVYDEHRNWPFTSAQIEELVDLYNYELNKPDEVDE